MKGFRMVWLGLLCAALVTAMMSGAYAEEKGPSTFKIGVVVELTGPVGPGGIDVQKGMRLAVEKAGATVAGKKIELLIEDSGGDPSLAMDKARKLIETDKVALIMGPILSGGQLALTSYAQKARVPWMGIMVNENGIATQKGAFAPQGIAAEAAYGPGIYAHDVLGYKTAVSLTADFVGPRQFFEAFKLGFEERGGKIIQETFYPEGTTNMVPYFTALKQADFIAYWGTPGDCFAAFPQYKELNLKMPLVQPEDGGVTATPGMLQHLGQAAVGTVFGTAYLYNANTPGNREFVEAYQQKYKELPGVFSGAGYADMQIVLAALKGIRDFRPDALYKAIKEVSVDTVRGRLHFPSEPGVVAGIANYPNLMARIGPNLEIIPLLPVDNVQVKFKNGHLAPYVVK
jgi:branched-chain amino acid transport system substrate-binding protein